MGKVKQRVGYVVYIIQGPKNIHKRHLNQLRKCRVNDSNVSPPQICEETIDIIYENFDLDAPKFLPRLDVQRGKGCLVILWASILKGKNTKQFFLSSEKKNLPEVGYYGTVTYPFMDSSKFYIDRELNTLVRDWILYR